MNSVNLKMEGEKCELSNRDSGQSVAAMSRPRSGPPASLIMKPYWSSALSVDNKPKFPYRKPAAGGMRQSE